MSWTMANEPNEPQEYPFFEQLEQRLLLSTGGTAPLAGELNTNPITHYEPFAEVVLQESASEQAASPSQVEGLAAPLSFDLRTQGYVTPVKDQGACGSCWAFATYGSLESSILAEGGSERDLSENHLKNYHGFDWGPCDGGNFWISQAYLSRWSGPVDEADDPYHDYDDRPSPGGPAQYYVRESLIFDTDDEMKDAVMAYGALYTSMYWDSGSFNSSDNTYYSKKAQPTNHAVTIVGWDDSKATAARTDGAWLIKNSWGTGWGDSGYFWLAYADANGGNSGVTFREAVEPDTFDTVYYHDDFGDVTEVNSPYAFNAFTATGDEALKAVQFWTQADGAGYDLSIYDTFSDGSLSDLLGSTTGTLTYGGHHTVDLPSLVPLASGNDFYVYLHITNGGEYPQSVDYVYPGYSSASTASPGESYYSFDGTIWTDLTTWDSTGNFAIKALTIEGQANAAPFFTSTPVTDATEDALYSYSVTAGDPDVGDSLTITAPTLPGWLVLTDNGDGTATLSGTPLNEHVGDNAVTLRVTDTAAATADQSFTITVANTNDDPFFTSAPVTDATEDTLYSYSVTADDPDVGDTLAFSVSSSAGWLTLMNNGDGTATLSGTPLNEHVGAYSVTLHVYDGMATADQSFTVTVDPAPAEVVGRHVFYNNSTFDGNDAAANANDDNAIGTDKAALLPGGTATFANYTSYSRGITGVIMDVDGLADADNLDIADFAFKVGNDDDPGSWADAPDPVSITVRQGEGDGGSDRVTIVWADNNLDDVVDPNEAVAKQWLQVTVLATDNTGLPQNDVFYFGNAVGDTGNSTSNVYVNAFDTGGVRDHPRGFLNPAPIDDVYDFNRDERVNAFDFGTARDNATGFLNALRLITVPGETGGMMVAGGSSGGGDEAREPTIATMPQPVAAAGVSKAVGRSFVPEDRFDLLGSAVQPLIKAKADDTTVTTDEKANAAADARQLLASLRLIQPLSQGASRRGFQRQRRIALESARAAGADAATDGDTGLADPLVDVLAASQLRMPLTT